MKDKIYSVLKKYWDYSSFRENQYEAISTLMNGENIVYIEKTGWGKSICYQIPAILWEWLTIIVSPLKSLMKDQVDWLLQKWISATYLNSDLDEKEYKERFRGLVNWEFKLLYVSPEKITWTSFLETLKNIPWWIDYFIVDEFDTVNEYWSTWFRPEYLELWKIKNQLQYSQDKKIVLWIFTATATPTVIELVTDMLHLEEKDYKLFKWKLIWDNMNLQIHKLSNKAEKDKLLYWYIQHIQKKLKQEKWSCIIFCSTTKNVDNIYKLLKDKWINIARYHAQMTTLLKNSAFKKFLSWEVNTIVCTNAFWRWVDKKDTRYILHYWIPSNISSYLQEVWRWGRDWKLYNAITLYSGEDITLRQFLHNWNSDQLEELNILINFLQKNSCRLSWFEEYFDYPRRGFCTQCDNCKSPNLVEINEDKLEEFKVKKVPRKKPTKTTKKVVKKKSTTSSKTAKKTWSKVLTKKKK